MASLSIFSKKHLMEFEGFLSQSQNPNDGVGKRPQAFAHGFPCVQLASLPTKQISRDEVFALSRNALVNTSTVCAAVLAWGGMRIANRDRLLSSDEWLPVAENIRGGVLNRGLAYEAFDLLYYGGRLKGLGPAYFTKLIYFLTPRHGPDQHHAYIMDQWAACSINLLNDRNVVLMDVVSSWKRDKDQPETNYLVSTANTRSNYEAFCASVDALASRFGKTPDQIDRALLGAGGRNPIGWRKYVLDNRRQF